MHNPFEIIDVRLSNIENMLSEIREKILIEKDLSNKRYSINEAAEILDVIPLTVRNHIKSGKIKASRLGRKYYISHDQLYDALNEVKTIKYKR